MKKIIYSIALLALSFSAIAQNKTIKFHSHNDYEQTVPLMDALGAGAGSVEIDVVLQNNQLYVAHEAASVNTTHTIEALYFEPLQRVSDLSLLQLQDLQLVIDFKSDGVQSMAVLLPILKQYEKLLVDNKISVVISGNKPNLSAFTSYPAYVYADYQSTAEIKDEKLWKKVAMMSFSFKDYSVWNGLGRLTREDKTRLEKIIATAHQKGKPIRFWASPDTKTAWNAFIDLGVDYINTDKPATFKTHVAKRPAYLFQQTTYTDIYHPTFASDQKQTPVKNVILLIGDGNGLTQISAAAFANKGDLSVLQLKSIGLIKTQSADDFTTDSAAAGTAIATGEKTFNRSIGMGMDRKPLQNMSELLKEHHFSVGLITTDEITGATPAAFYAHQVERDYTAEIASDLSKSKIDLFVGGGAKSFQKVPLSKQFTVLNTLTEIGQSKADRVGLFLANGSPASISEGRGNELKEATKQGIEFLKQKNKPFFLMVEGSKIDSYGHANNTGGIILEGIDFDKAIAQALEFADQDGETLVVVMADHETGGFSISQGDIETGQIVGDFISNDHSGVMVPIFAYGPHSNEFTGVFQNNEVFQKITKLLSIKK